MKREVTIMDTAMSKRDGVRGYSILKSVIVVLTMLTVAGCEAPSTLSNANQYVRIGVLPTYEPTLLKATPPTWSHGPGGESLDLDFGVNALEMERVVKSAGKAHQIVDLSSVAAAYMGTPKVHAFGERKIFGDSRPLFTDVLRSMVGNRGLDAYVVIEGGQVELYEPIVAPIVQMLASQGHDLGLRLTIYVIDGRTFEVAAVRHDFLTLKGVPDSWFVAPRQHVDEIKRALVDLLDTKLEPDLRELGLI